MQTPKVKITWTGPNKRLPGRGNVVRGQEIEVSRRDLKTFKALGWGAETPQAVEAQMPAEQQPDPLEALRSEYQSVVGRRAYHGWDAEQLRGKIEQARQGSLYNRRDLRPEE